MHTPHPPPLSRLYRKKQARYIGDAVIARLQTRNGTHKTTLGLQQTPAAAVSTGCYRSSSGSVWPRITTTLTILRRFHMYSRKEKHAPFMAGICPSLLRKKLRLTASLLKQFWEAAKLDPTPFAKGSFLLDIGDHRPKGVATVATTGRILRTLGRLEHVLLTQAALQKVTLSEALQLRTRREAAQGFRKFTPAKPRKAAAQAEKTPRGANSEHSFLFCSPFPRGCTKGRAPPRCESSAKARGGDSASCRQEHCTSTPPPPPLQKRSSNRPPLALYLLCCTPRTQSKPSVSWLYFARRSERQGAPVLICPVPRVFRWREPVVCNMLQLQAQEAAKVPEAAFAGAT